MTREEARKAAEVMLAYANGEEIEIAYSNSSYQTVTSPEFNWGKVEYRVKPKPTYRPFKDNEECWNEMLKHQPIGYIKGKVQKNVVFITEISTNTHNELSFSLSISTSVYDAECLFSSYTFADGTPFGIQED